MGEDPSSGPSCCSTPSSLGSSWTSSRIASGASLPITVAILTLVFGTRCAEAHCRPADSPPIRFDRQTARVARYRWSRSATAKGGTHVGTEARLRHLSRGRSRTTSRSGACGVMRACGPCGRSASGPSSPATSTAGTSAWPPEGSAVFSSPAWSSRSCTTASCYSHRRDVPRAAHTRAARTRSPDRRWAHGEDSSPVSPRTWSTSSRRPWSSARSAC